MYGSGENPSNNNNDKYIREEYGYIEYNYNQYVPRNMNILIPKANSEYRYYIKPTSNIESIQHLHENNNYDNI